jgi:hypothetical protein
MTNEFRVITDARLGDTDFTPTGVGDPAFANGYDILLAAPDSLGQQWDSYVEQARYDDSDTLLDCHDDAVVIALAYFNTKAAWGNAAAISEATARRRLAQAIAEEYDTATPERRAELERAERNPRSWAQARSEGRAGVISVAARGLRCAQLFHMTPAEDGGGHDVHTHLLIAPEIVASAEREQLVGRVRPGELYEIDTVTLASVLPAIFTAYDDAVETLVAEQLGVHLELDGPPRLLDPYDPRGERRGKVDCRPSFRMRQFDQVSGATWRLSMR